MAKIIARHNLQIPPSFSHPKRESDSMEILDQE